MPEDILTTNRLFEKRFSEIPEHYAGIIPIIKALTPLPAALLDR